ncbi:MAG: heme-binding protein [Phreatobacter sp.]|uniref:GlcG/HbpS family heme-binding protein n=1 Tax=Phreatobacter sp. TaxID=1966341 RepID=UPI001A3D80F6|nr:heme-binding protein [Phreatobacter sp.]MBL8571671.1 heme-binding protein [Phreatobacter sp.]
MKLRSLIALAGFCLPAGAHAQAPQTERNVSMSMAQAIIAGVVEECAKSSYRVSVVIVDKAGQVSAALRGDGTSPHTVEFARMKAYTARTRNQTSLEFAAATASGDAMALRQIPGVIAIGGGVPIRAGSETIGAVGVSGAPGGDKDEVCARAGIARVAAALN